LKQEERFVLRYFLSRFSLLSLFFVRPRLSIPSTSEAKGSLNQRSTHQLCVAEFEHRRAFISTTCPWRDIVGALEKEQPLIKINLLLLLLLLSTWK
jgi:hypothetical protein